MNRISWMRWRQFLSGNPKSQIKNLKWTGFAALGIVFAAWAGMAGAQETKIPRIGFLFASNPATASARIEAFREGLRQLGYVEGKNYTIEFRFAEGKIDRVPAFAAELVNSKVDVIVTGGATDTRAAKEATKTIPIVMLQDNDPVASGLVTSLARPGGNITGLSTLSPELSGKQLQLLKEIVPKLSRVAVFGTSANSGNAEKLREVELAAKALKLKLQILDILNPMDIEAAFRAATKERAEAILELGSFVINVRRTEVIDLAVKNRLPAIYFQREIVEAGGLMTYGPSQADLARRAATYVDKILKGAKPADLPVEQPMKLEFIVNLKAAKQIGLTIPPNVLARADRVIR